MIPRTRVVFYCGGPMETVSLSFSFETQQLIPVMAINGRGKTKWYNCLIMEQSKLTAYVAGQLKAGISPDAVRQHLLLVGWSEEDAGAAIVSGLVESGVPTPENRMHSGRGTLSSTVEVVLNFFSFILLALSRRRSAFFTIRSSANISLTRSCWGMGHLIIPQVRSIMRSQRSSSPSLYMSLRCDSGSVDSGRTKRRWSRSLRSGSPISCYSSQLSRSSATSLRPCTISFRANSPHGSY